MSQDEIQNDRSLLVRFSIVIQFIAYAENCVISNHSMIILVTAGMIFFASQEEKISCVE